MTSDGFYRPEELERRACLLLQRHVAKSNEPLCPPVPIESIAEVTLGLTLAWGPIPEPADRTILAQLTPGKRQVTFNENHRGLFETVPGLYNTTLAHEVGHWMLHVDYGALGTMVFPGFEAAGEFTVYSKDEWNDRNAHRFMSYLLLPDELLQPTIQSLENSLQDPRTLYRLREKFDVTITVLKIRLEQLTLLYIDRRGRLHRSAGEAAGQMRMQL